MQDQTARRLLEDILAICQPRQVILFAEKRTMSTNELKSVSLCIVIPEGDARAARTRLHLAISADFPVTLSVYTADEWQSLLEDEASYAAWIARKGQVLYGPET